MGIVIHVTATGVIVREGRVLLGKRTSKIRFAGMWDAFGGHLVPCEDPAAALARELAEELGIRISAPRFLGIYEDVDPTSKEVFRHYLFLVTGWDGEPKIANEEHSEIRWFAPAEAVGLDLAASLKDAIRRLLPDETLSAAPDIDATRAMSEDDQVRKILKEIRTIAVVGCSKDPAKDAHRVPKYLQMHGYRIIPVNPTATEILGEKAYPSLEAVPVPYDAVDVFRPSADVPPIVDQAIRGPAKVVWMQLGIRNEEAAKAARAAGKTVIQDRCMMRDHARLFGGQILE